MAARSRSPNYPSMSLGDSIEAIQKVYVIERRAKFPRTSLAAHLGYSSLNGRALAKIGALRAYNLIDGKEDSLCVSPTAIALIDAPKDSEDYISALHEAFNAPPLFGRIVEEHGEEIPSPQTLRWWLSKQGYVGEAADKALSVYLASAELVNSVGSDYLTPNKTEETPMETSTLSRERREHDSRASRVVAAVGATNAFQPDFKIQLGSDRWLLIEVKGGAPTSRDFVKLEKFARFQRELLEDENDCDQAPSPTAAPDDENRGL